MSVAYADRVAESTATTGTGTLTLAGALTVQYQAFSVFPTGTTVDYAIFGAAGWEVGQGVYTTSGTTLSRLVVYASSNAGALVSLTGTSTVICTLPAAKAATMGQIMAAVMAASPQ
jgi:hypothetical protein